MRRFNRLSPPLRSGLLGPHDPMARDVINPRKHQRDWETQHNGDYHKSLGPVGYFKRRKHLRHDLNQQPRHDCVRDRDAINSSSLQFRKKVFQLHGSIRIGSKPRICSSVGNGNFEIYYPISAGFVSDWAPPVWRSRSTFENADRCGADPIPSDVSDR